MFHDKPTSMWYDTTIHHFELHLAREQITFVRKYSIFQLHEAKCVLIVSNLTSYTWKWIPMVTLTLILLLVYLQTQIMDCYLWNPTV